MNNKRIVIIISVIFVFVVAVSYFLSRSQNKKINNIVENKSIPITKLSFLPSTNILEQGQNFSITSIVDSGERLVTGIDLEFVFDPSLIQIDSMVPTPSIMSLTESPTGQVIKNEIDNKNGRAKFVAFTFDKTLGVSGIQNILTLNGSIVEGSKLGEYKISYGQSTAVAAISKGENSNLKTEPIVIGIATEDE